MHVNADVLAWPCDRPQHDEVILPDAERLFAQRMGATVVDLASSHVVMVSHAEETADLIETAVQDVTE